MLAGLFVTTILQPVVKVLVTIIFLKMKFTSAYTCKQIDDEPKWSELVTTRRRTCFIIYRLAFGEELQYILKF